MPEGTHCTLHASPMGEESPRLSNGSSVGSHDPLSSIPTRDCCTGGLPCSETSEDERPVSLVSTLSSSSSRDESLSVGSSSTTPLPLSTPSQPPSEEEDNHIDLHLSPPEAPLELPPPKGGAPESAVKGGWKEHLLAPTAELTPRKLSLPTSPPHSPFATIAMAPNPQLTYLDRVIMEIIETEQMYVRDLCSIVEDYLSHIIDTGTLGPEQVSALFGNIEDIYEFNGELLQALYMCDNDPVAIARCFVEKSEYFEIYTQYCTNYPNSVAALTECMRSKNLAKFFRERQASLELPLPLGSYLLKPVQRILKYHLLLQEIAKHFNQEEEGYEVVQEAIDTMTAVAWYINDMKRKHEHAVRLQEIQSLLINWKGPDLTTYGELVLEGTFHVQRAKNERTLFLFDRMLLITRKRGEHYIFKHQISCSTLMLIESAKDCLSFSVTHYKHPKQPHTVQARTLEEKKLWAHHIKRLILENHQAVIPQKAKEAILDIDPLCPRKYSPDRPKKPPFFTEEFSKGRKERRRSEPAKQIKRFTKDVLKHAESETTLLADDASDSCSLHPASSFSSLASSLCECQAPRPSVEQGLAEECSPNVSEPRDKPGCEETPLVDMPEQTHLESEAECMESRMEDQEVEEQREEEARQEEEEKEEEMLVVDDQGSEGLAAEDKGQAVPGERPQTTPEAEVREPAMEETLNDKITKEERCPQVREVPLILIQESSPLPTRSSLSSQEEEEEEEQLEEISVSSTSAVSGEEINNSAITQTSATNRPCLENGIDGEELDEVEEEAVDMRVGVPNGYVLPPLAVDQATTIAQQYSEDLPQRNCFARAESTEHGQLTPTVEAESCTACPPLGSSRCDDTVDSAPLECLGGTPTLRLESTPTQLEETQTLRSRQDSTLSKKDRLLIHKIRRYYEHAEHHDMGFCIKRRESLSYIPAGLVRHLSRQINDAPKDQAIPATPAHRKGSPGSRPTSWSVFNLPGLDKKDEGPASHEQDVTCPANGGHGAKSRTGSSGDADAITQEDFSSPSRMLSVWQDMEADVGGLQGNGLDNGVADGCLTPGNLPLDSRGVPRQDHNDPNDTDALLLLDDADVSSVTDDSSVASTPVFSSPTKGAEDSLPRVSTQYFQRGRGLRAPLPRVITLRSGLEEEQILQDAEKVKNKVFQLARQYSQRIKNNRPVPRPRGREVESLFTSHLPSVQEERTQGRNKGSSSEPQSMSPQRQDPTGLALPLSTYDQVMIQDVKPRSPSPCTSSASSSRVQSPSGKPLSPSPGESFNWPAVRELRSKYAPGHRLDGRRTAGIRHGGGKAGGTGVIRSHSSPEQMMRMVAEMQAEAKLEREEERVRTPRSRSSSTSSSCVSLDLRSPMSDSCGPVARHPPQGLRSDSQSQTAKGSGRGSSTKLCRANSLDHVPSIRHHVERQSQQMQQLQHQQQQHQRLEDFAESIKNSRRCNGVGEVSLTQDNDVAAETDLLHLMGRGRGKGMEKVDAKDSEEEMLNEQDDRSALELEAWKSLRRGDWRSYERLQSQSRFCSTSLKRLDGRQHSLVRNLRDKFQSLSSYT